MTSQKHYRKKERFFPPSVPFPALLPMAGLSSHVHLHQGTPVPSYPPSTAPLIPLPPLFRQQHVLKLGMSGCAGEETESSFSTTSFNSSFSFKRLVLQTLPCWLFLRLHVCPQNTVFWQNSGLKRKFIGNSSVLLIQALKTSCLLVMYYCVTV